MPKFLVTLATYESDFPCTAQVEVEADTAKEAERIAEYEMDKEEMEWSDDLGNEVSWDDVDGPVTVAAGTEQI